jgi:hypothetical protein
VKGVRQGRLKSSSFFQVYGKIATAHSVILRLIINDDQGTAKDPQGETNNLVIKLKYEK